MMTRDMHILRGDSGDIGDMKLSLGVPVSPRGGDSVGTLGTLATRPRACPQCPQVSPSRTLWGRIAGGVREALA